MVSAQTTERINREEERLAGARLRVLSAQLGLVAVKPEISLPLPNPPQRGIIHGLRNAIRGRLGKPPLPTRGWILSEHDGGGLALFPQGRLAAYTGTPEQPALDPTPVIIREPSLATPEDGAAHTLSPNIAIGLIHAAEQRLDLEGAIQTHRGR